MQQNTRLAFAITALIAAYWTGKVATQIAYYPMYDIPQKWHFKIGSYFMNTLFLLFASVFTGLLVIKLIQLFS